MRRLVCKAAGLRFTDLGLVGWMPALMGDFYQGPKRIPILIITEGEPPQPANPFLQKVSEKRF